MGQLPLRALAIAFAAMGGTSFRKANLTDANFTQATLSSHSTTFVTAYLLLRGCNKSLESWSQVSTFSA